MLPESIEITLAIALLSDPVIFSPIIASVKISSVDVNVNLSRTGVLVSNDSRTAITSVASGWFKHISLSWTLIPYRALWFNPSLILVPGLVPDLRFTDLVISVCWHLLNSLTLFFIFDFWTVTFTLILLWFGVSPNIVILLPVIMIWSSVIDCIVPFEYATEYLSWSKATKVTSSRSTEVTGRTNWPNALLLSFVTWELRNKVESLKSTLLTAMSGILEIKDEFCKETSCTPLYPIPVSYTHLRAHET